MTLNHFNPELLEFMDSLVNSPEFMNIDRAANYFNSQRSEPVSPMVGMLKKNVLPTPNSLFIQMIPP